MRTGRKVAVSASTTLVHDCSTGRTTADRDVVRRRSDRMFSRHASAVASSQANLSRMAARTRASVIRPVLFEHVPHATSAAQSAVVTTFARSVACKPVDSPPRAANAATIRFSMHRRSPAFGRLHLGRDCAPLVDKGAILRIGCYKVRRSIRVRVHLLSARRTIGHAVRVHGGTDFARDSTRWCIAVQHLYWNAVPTRASLHAHCHLQSGNGGSVQPSFFFLNQLAHGNPSFHPRL